MLDRRLDPFRGHSLPEVFPPVPSRWGTAAFSPCGSYRWWLQRTWDDERPTLVFVGLNPSRADAQRDDPTLRRLLAFGRRWGFGRLEVLNLFAWVASSPDGLRRTPEPVGGENEDWIRRRLAAQSSWCSEPPPNQNRNRNPNPDPEPEPDQALSRLAWPTASALWLGWGQGGAWKERDRWMGNLLAGLCLNPLALGCTRSGQPRHPLYCSAAMTLTPFAPSWGQIGDTPPDPCHASLDVFTFT